MNDRDTQNWLKVIGLIIIGLVILTVVTFVGILIVSKQFFPSLLELVP